MNRQDEMITLANSSRPGDTSWVNGGTTAASAGGKFARRAPLDVKTCIHSGGVDKVKLWEELGKNCLIYMAQCTSNSKTRWLHCRRKEETCSSADLLLYASGRCGE